MALNSSSFLSFMAALLLLISLQQVSCSSLPTCLQQASCSSHSRCYIKPPPHSIPIAKRDIDLMHFAENLEFLEAEWFLWGSLGYGLDYVRPELTGGGPPPIGVEKANLDPLVYKIVKEFGYQEVGHLRALRDTVGLIPRPLMNLSAAAFATVFNNALNTTLDPPFDPYASSLAYMMASYVIPYVGLVGYVGANPQIEGYVTKRVSAGLLGVEAGQDAVIRIYLYERAKQVFKPYNVTVAEMTIAISGLRNQLGGCGIRDEGLFVPLKLGAENRTTSNILSANAYSISYPRTPPQILGIAYGTGREDQPGLFFPRGANGKIAQRYLHQHE